MLKAPPILVLLCFGLLDIACSGEAPPVDDDPMAAGTSTSTGETATSDTPTTALDSSGTVPGSTGSTSASGTGTTMIATSSDAQDDTADPPPSCGDGVVDASEECDDGAGGNDDTRFCKENCELNVCGDGMLFVGWELCDEGAANSDGYGSLCDKKCEPGPRCGDGKLQAVFETCDLGIDNDSEKGDVQGILCDSTCRAQQLRGFITKDAFDGDLGGLFGADLKCRAAAMAAGLAEPDRFHAYLSTDAIDAKERFEEVAASLPFVLVTGKKIADNFMALIKMGPLGNGISITEYGSSLDESYVATNTAPGGVSFSPDQHCQGWTSASDAHSLRAGINALPVGSPDAMIWKDELWWTGVEKRPCHKVLFHLYCLEI